MDQIREAFKRSYKPYVKQKLAMDTLLFRHIATPEPLRTIAVQEQQLSLDLAFRQYEEARSDFRCFVEEPTEADDTLHR